MEAWPDNSWCGAVKGTQWCVRASVFGSFGQLDGAAAAIDYDDQVTIEYALQSDNVNWLQTVTSAKLGRVVSTYTSASGRMIKGGYGFGTECDANSYTLDNQYYINTVIKLRAADPNFGATGVPGNGGFDNGSGPYGSAKNIKTTDGGVTWTVDMITLPAMVPSGPQSQPPTTTSATVVTSVSKTSAKSSTITTSTTASSGCSAKYAQCGGEGWTGATCCVSSACTYSNAWYSQCL
ncbi:hypothetical protein HDU84_008324 [Entophlyctis sp. JEL0112]|nr:hypothetical protein HDU84_008324 [Entophlyctis sp. JEL0112]